MKKLFWLLLMAQPLITTAQVADSAQRVVKVQGAVNFRDLGGYATKDGKQVKWGKLYRSAAIDRLTGADLDTVAARKIHTVIDFRGTAEAAKAPDRLLAGTDYLLCPAGSENVGNMMKEMQAARSGDSLMLAFYGNADSLGARYKPFFHKLLQLPDTSALLFHCTAGKDRTGIGAALLLHALGVSDATIVNDYEASNIYRETENKKMVAAMSSNLHIKPEVAAAMAGVKARYLQATYQAILGKYGSMEAFMQLQLGLGENDLRQLRTSFLE